MAETTLWAARAWVEGAWQDRVVLRIDTRGCWAEVRVHADPPPGATVLDGPALPGMVNAHSHAFQRAFAGMAEQRAAGQDDFWSWRDRMYAVALRVTPEQQQAIAAQLYAELLRGGYTHVCEFHYLHNALDGAHYAPAITRMADALADAALEVGMGLTLLPTVYERAGFTSTGLREDQRRFRADAQTVAAMRRQLRQRHAGTAGALVRVGAALHSLRAATPEAVAQLAADGDAGPLHIHVAEQVSEVDDCRAATGQRPIEWLASTVALDGRWQLVHATHATPGEIAAVARSGAGVVICPTTEANLGDGLVDLPGWLTAGVSIALGSDSHVCRSVAEELRLLEYGQRLAQRVRCVGAAPDSGEPSTAARLFNLALRGGAAAAGFAQWGLEPGARADLLVIDTGAHALLGVPPAHVLDALVFSSPARPFRDVMVAGKWATRAHRSARATGVAARFTAAMHELHGRA